MKRGKYLICPICGKEFYIMPHEIKAGRKYCSMQCMGVATGKRFKGKPAPWNGKPAIRRECKICGREFKIFQSELRNRRGICCSRKCANKWHSIQLTGKKLSEPHKQKISKANKENHRPDLAKKWEKYKRTKKEEDRPVPLPPPPELLIYQCHWCGIVWLTRKQGSRKKEQHHFCCYLHYRKWMKQISSGKNNPMYGISGEQSPNWQDGISFEPYLPEFNNELKEKIRKRDNYQCQYCGKSQIENGRRLDVHHINYDKKDNSLMNVISLCMQCHHLTYHNRKYWQSYFENFMMEKFNIDLQKTTTASYLSI